MNSPLPLDIVYRSGIIIGSNQYRLAPDAATPRARKDNHRMTAAVLLIVSLILILIVAGLLTIAFTGDSEPDPAPQVIYTQAGKVTPGSYLQKR